MVVDDDQNVFCSDSLDALAVYMKYGLEPGSFCQQLLYGNDQQAYRHAHPLLKPRVVEDPYKRLTPDVVANMLRFVRERVPACARGPKNYNRWVRQRGLEGTTDLDIELVEMKLKEITPWWDNHRGLP